MAKEITIVVSDRDFEDMMTHLAKARPGRPLVAVELLRAVEGDEGYNLGAYDEPGLLEAVNPARAGELAARRENAAAAVRPKTALVAGHRLTLTAGVRYRASRPFAARGRREFPVSIESIEAGPAGTLALIVVPKLDYEAADRLVTEFNNGDTSFEGRVW